MEWLKVAVVCFSFCGLCSTMTNSEIEDFKNFLEKTSQLDQIFVKKGANPDTDYDDEDSIPDDAWEESGKFEGDLILNDRQRRVIVQDVVEGLSRNGIRDTTKRWPDNELIYYIQREHFTSDQVQAIQDGIEDLSRASCVKFRHYKKGDRDAVVIQGSRRGCFSQVGYQGGYQVLNLNRRHPPGRGCFRHGTIVHELLHSLGFYHMQSSPDRDDYIDVKWENIHQPARHNFRKYNTFSVSDFGVGYDYESVLHYSRRAFSINGQDTLVPKQSGASIGQRVGLSDKDTQKFNKMYCDADSNNQEAIAADEPIRKKGNKKKNPKNKPFEGHGIGYHQGKTIVIKLPTVQTIKLPEAPIFHVFDHFSKSPQAVSTQALEGFGAGQEVRDQYEPYHIVEDYSVAAIPYPQNKNDSAKKQDEYNGSVHEEYDYTASPYGKEKGYYDDNGNEVSITTKPSIRKNADKNENTEYADVKDSSPELIEKNNTGQVSDIVDEAFDRLAKIIKTHVYPSQTPDLDIYKTTTDYSKFYTPEVKPEPESVISKLDKTFSSRIFPNEYTNVSHDKKDKINSSDHEIDYKAHEEFQKDKYEPLKIVSESPNDNENSEEFDASYGTSLPLKQMLVVKEEKLIRPSAYATFKNLANKHDYSGLYYPKEGNKQQRENHSLFGYLLPAHNEWFDDIKKDNEKYDREAYSYPPDSSREHVVSSKLIQLEPDRPAQEIFGLQPDGTAYSLFGILVPLTQKWYRIDYDPHSPVYSLDKPESNEDYR